MIFRLLSKEVLKVESKPLPQGTSRSAFTEAPVSLQPRHVVRSSTRWGRSVLEWPSLDAFLATTAVQSGVHSVPIGEFAGKPINYDFFLTARPGTVLLCHFHGNAPPEGRELPIFTGLGVTGSITTSMFVPSDPVLVLDASLSLAWHFGCEGIQLQAMTVRIVQKLKALLDAPRVVAWGGSGGGFAAIRVAKDVPTAIALVWNPQTDIAKYVPEPVARYRGIAFPNIAADGPLPAEGEQFSSLCTEAFRDSYQGRILYLQERTDWHVGAHLEPFLAAFCRKDLRSITKASNFTGFVTEQLYLHLGHWGDGHIPPSKDTLAKLLEFLSDITMKVEDLVSLDCFPQELPSNTAEKRSQASMVTLATEQRGASQFGSDAFEHEPLNLKEILSIRMDHITDYFPPLDATVNCAGDLVLLPLPTGENIEISRIHGASWNRKFAKEASSSILWLFSLAWIGRLLTTFEQRKDEEILLLAVGAIKSFVDYSDEPDRQSSIGNILSADHSTATRITVLIKFIQVMRERQDADQVLLERVCKSLKYWSDWLCEPEHFAMTHHGLMASIALLHTAVQFGAAPYASRYRDVATDRIMELGKVSFDRDGLCYENTIGYHNYNMQCYRRLQRFLKHYSISGPLGAFVEDLIVRAAEALEFCVWQDGSIPPIGDSSVYQSKIVSRNKSRCFYESGFAVIKNDDLYLSVICGSRTEYHKQVDDSSITLRFMNRDVLIDGGSYTYDLGDPHRRCVESTLGHSGVFLKECDGLLRKEFVRRFGLVSGQIERFEESSEGVRLSCRYNVRNGGVTFIRKIFVCWPDEVAIVDSIALSILTGSPETVQRFLFGPTLDARFDEKNKLILTSKDFSCTLFQLVDCDSVLYRGEDANPVRGWCSYKFKEILPTYGVDFLQSSRRTRFATIIKLGNCTGLSDCSPAVRAFVDRGDS